MRYTIELSTQVITIEVAEPDWLDKTLGDSDWLVIKDTSGVLRRVNKRYIVQIITDTSWSGITTSPSPEEVAEKKMREEAKRANDPESYIIKK